MYSVKEMFYSLQGEGANTGRPAVFLRLTGCNMWSGREIDRAGSCSAWCDTDFVGADAGKHDARELAEQCSQLWPEGARLNLGLTFGLNPLCVITGGEPMLQVKQDLISALHSCNFEVAVETNGTIPVPDSVDWITVSPKSGSEVVQRRGQEIKLVFPQEGINPADYLGWSFSHFYIQPCDGPSIEENTRLATAYCLENPRWRLSLQTHKMLGLR